MGDFANTIKGQVNDNLEQPEFHPGTDADGNPVEDMGYIKGYQNFSFIDGLIEETKVTNLLSNTNLLNEGKKLTSYNPSDEKNLPTEAENTFIKGVTDTNHIDFYWEDPTYLGFQVRFSLIDSPLFNYSSDPYNDSSINKNSALKFLFDYRDIPEVGKRVVIYREFIKELLKLFNTIDNPSNNGKKQYYIESILGLERMMAKHVKYEEDLIKITMTEDVTLRVLYLAELYNNLVYSYRTQSYMIPENCLRFDMEIKVTDYRKFKITNKNFGENDPKRFVKIPEEDTPRFIYKLRDCNFDFSDSNVVQDQLSMAGFGMASPQSAALTFNIKYKSVERIFHSTLIDESYMIQNKSSVLYQQIGIDQDSFVEKSIRHKEPEPNTEVAPSGLGDFKTFAKKAGDDITNSLKNTVLDNTGKFIDAGFAELRKQRGALVNNLTGQLRSFAGNALGLGGELPKIYPDNVYASDFGDFSLDNFASGLVTGIYNDFEGGLTDTLNGIGGF